MHAELTRNDILLFWVILQVEWPEQAVSQQHPGSWDPLASQARPAEKHLEMPQKSSTNDHICLMLGLGTAGALAVAVAFAWLYIGS
jgi:hypothetical protein